MIQYISVPMLLDARVLPWPPNVPHPPCRCELLTAFYGLSGIATVRMTTILVDN